jgi:nucleotide-binding universal stress UspA family protein
MKTILGLIGGGERDAVILQTAFAAAAPLSAHLDFLHIYVSAGIAAQYDDAVQFAVGAAIGDSLDELTSKAKNFSSVAADHVHEFCKALKIEICEAPAERKKVTANYREEKDATTERLIDQAQQSDLTVLGRAVQTQGLAPATLERLVRNCGRPVLVAATAAPRTLTGTVMVCWNESDNVARAVAAAAPILKNAKRVVFACVATHNKEDIAIADDLIQQFAGNGVLTETRIIPANREKIPALLAIAADDCNADLVVMGAYGRSRMHELIFDSRTDALLRDIDRPILLMH